MRFILLAILLAFTTITASRGADDPLLDEATGLLGPVMFLDSGAPGMVLVVVDGDRTLIRGYGETTKGNGHAPDGTTLFRLNSMSKVFTTEVLASMAAAGRLALTDPLEKFAGGATVPAFGAHKVTLLDLATHTAALPREMGDLPEGANPRAWPTRADRWKWLPGYKLPWAPGTVASYSNVGFDLLADALGRAADQPYAALLRSYVTGPLGMKDTTATPTPDECARLMTGSGLGGAVPCSDTHATEGSGGLYSTGDDIAIWLRHNLEDTDGALALTHAVYRLRQAMPAAIGFDEGGRMAGIGLGWVMVAASGAEPMILEKSGGGAGFMSYVAFVPGKDVGVFWVVNRVDFPMFYGLADAAHKLIASLVTR